MLVLDERDRHGHAPGFFLVLACQAGLAAGLLLHRAGGCTGVRGSLVLHRATGYWLGNPGFAHYNVAYSLHPVRMALSFARRFYYVFFAEFRWIGTAVLILTARKCAAFRSPAWESPLRSAQPILCWYRSWGARSWNDICCRCCRYSISLLQLP